MFYSSNWPVCFYFYDFFFPNISDYFCSIGDSLDLVPIAAFHGRGKRTGKANGHNSSLNVLVQTIKISYVRVHAYVCMYIHICTYIRRLAAIVCLALHFFPFVETIV